MYVCTPHLNLVPTEAREGAWKLELQVVVKHWVGAGTRVPLLLKSSQSFFPAPQMFLTPLIPGPSSTSHHSVQTVMLIE